MQWPFRQAYLVRIKRSFTTFEIFCFSAILYFLIVTLDEAFYSVNFQFIFWPQLFFSNLWKRVTDTESFFFALIDQCSSYFVWNAGGMRIRWLFDLTRIFQRSNNQLFKFKLLLFTLQTPNFEAFTLFRLRKKIILWRQIELFAAHKWWIRNKQKVNANEAYTWNNKQK